jgi:maltose alpha-D-glucosyltransferase/alpha-amylase
MRAKVAGNAAPYNHLYRPEKDGVATTFAGYIAPALGIKDPYNASQEEVERIAQGHLLLAAANALQPGVFSLSSWDLVGALPVPAEGVKQWSAGGDWRWVNRGGVDPLGASPRATQSAFGIPRAKALYGPLPEQLRDPRSFASRLKEMLAARKQAHLPEAELRQVPEPAAPGTCLLVFGLPDGKQAVTALNFARREVEAELDLGKAAAGKDAIDLLTRKAVGKIGPDGKLKARLPGLTGTTFTVGE